MFYDVGAVQVHPVRSSDAYPNTGFQISLKLKWKPIFQVALASKTKWHIEKMDSRWISVFTMDFWIQDGFLESRWISGFTMDFWIHNGYWFWVHELFLLGGLPPPRPPAVSGGLPTLQTSWRGACSPSQIFERSWHQDLGTKILSPRSRYHNSERTSIK